MGRARGRILDEVQSFFFSFFKKPQHCLVALSPSSSHFDFALVQLTPVQSMPNTECVCLLYSHTIFCQKLVAASSTQRFTKYFQKETEQAGERFEWNGGVG